MGKFIFGIILGFISGCCFVIGTIIQNDKLRDEWIDGVATRVSDRFGIKGIKITIEGEANGNLGDQ